MQIPIITLGRINFSRNGPIRRTASVPVKNAESMIPLTAKLMPPSLSKKYFSQEFFPQQKKK